MKNFSIKKVKEKDIMLRSVVKIAAGKMYSKDLNKKDYRASPICVNFPG